MPGFVLEIGAEEIPARFLPGAERALAEFFETSLAEALITHGKIKTFSTPGRLAVIIEDLPEKQPEREEIITGPPSAIAWNKQGEPGPALLGFAKSNGISPDAVFRQKTNKGEYVACRKLSGGRPVSEVLAELAPRAIANIPFGKKMRWGSNDITFARPLRWLLALFGSAIVPFKFGPLESGRQTWGHRVHGPGPYDISNADQYEAVVANNCAIVLDNQDRQRIIRETGDRLAAKIGGKVLWDDKLLEEVAGLVEHPVPLLGEFDSCYLEVPDAALLTSMQTHQKSFGIRGKDGRLLPNFLTVLNLDPKDVSLVKKGWEKVLRARLEDARFFWKSDLEQNLETWLEQLDHVIFIGPLGSMGEQATRLESLCSWLAQKVAPEDLDFSLASRAGKLAKADLVSSMVGEFDTLQGIMGGIYAAKAGEPEIVATAISEQYLPAGPNTPLPVSATGAILATATRADTLTGCFGLNMIPTGAADPNGLRRCALGIIRIFIERKWSLDVRELFRECWHLYGDKKWKLPLQEAEAKLLEFFSQRLRNYFLTVGYSTRLVDAVIATDSTNPADAKARLDALTAFSKSESFAQACQTLKRIENITRKAAGSATEWQDAALLEDEEKALAATLNQLLPALDASINSSKYEEALASLEELRAPVDNFFDRILVMSEDLAIRENRINLLNAIGSRFGKIANFSLLQL